VAAADARVSALVAVVAKRAGQAEVASALARAATAESVGVLARTVARDVVPRLDEPCVAAAAAAERARAAEARVAALEAAVAAHDAALRDARAAFARETGALVAAVRGATDAAADAAAAAARASEGDAAATRARVDALAQVVDGAAAAHADVAAATAAALGSSRERLRAVEAALADLLSGLGVRSGSGGGGGAAEARAALERAVDGALKTKLVGLSRAVDAHAAAAQERLADGVAAAVDAAVATAKAEVATEVKKSQRARSEVRAAATAATAAAAAAPPPAAAAADVRAAVDAAVAAAVAPLRALVLAATTQVDDASARAAEAAANAARSAEGAGAAARGAEARLEARLSALEARAEERDARGGVDAAIASLEARLEARVGERASEAAVAASASEARAAAMSAAADAAASAAAVRALQDLSARLRGAAAAPPATPARGSSSSGGADDATVAATPFRSLPDSTAVAGRWIWKTRMSRAVSGLDSRFRVVCFDVAALNTAPEGLKWSAESGGDEIVAVKSGLYRVSLGFFAAAPPSLALIVDDFVAFTALPPALRKSDDNAALPSVPEYASSSIVLHSHPCGSVAGVSVTQYVALPSSARLSVAYAGENRGQGCVDALRKNVRDATLNNNPYALTRKDLSSSRSYEGGAHARQFTPSSKDRSFSVLDGPYVESRAACIKVIAALASSSVGPRPTAATVQDGEDAAFAIDSNSSVRPASSPTKTIMPVGRVMVLSTSAIGVAFFEAIKSAGSGPASCALSLIAALKPPQMTRSPTQQEREPSRAFNAPLRSRSSMSSGAPSGSARGSALCTSPAVVASSGRSARTWAPHAIMLSGEAAPPSRAPTNVVSLRVPRETMSDEMIARTSTSPRVRSRSRFSGHRGCTREKGMIKCRETGGGGTSRGAGEGPSTSPPFPPLASFDPGSG
jgi:hypothetical protein